MWYLFDKYNKQLWKIVNAIISKDEAGESHRVVVVNKGPRQFFGVVSMIR